MRTVAIVGLSALALALGAAQASAIDYKSPAALSAQTNGPAPSFTVNHASMTDNGYINRDKSPRNY